MTGPNVATLSKEKIILTTSGDATKAVQEMFADLCSREMTHEVVNAVAGANAIAYVIRCRYPDGCNVIGLYNATLRDGRIVSEISVDCWDE